MIFRKAMKSLWHFGRPKNCWSWSTGCPTSHFHPGHGSRLAKKRQRCNDISGVLRIDHIFEHVFFPTIQLIPSLTLPNLIQVLSHLLTLSPDRTVNRHPGVRILNTYKNGI